MKTIQILLIAMMIFGFSNKTKTEVEEKTNYELVVIDQNFEQAIKLAKKSNKLLFIDFYATWCGPCKQLDRLIFQNDSIQKVLGEDYILLKYDAEKDTTFNLTKKYHIRSYPTAIVLNSDGFVLHKRYGFRGDDYKSLSSDVLKFTKEASEFANKNQIIEGYSNQINVTNYPKPYVAFINREAKRVDAAELNEYWETEDDVLFEGYFASLCYFSESASDNTINKVIANKNKYESLYGESDVSNMIYHLMVGKFDNALEAKSQAKFDEAAAYAKEVLSSESYEDIIFSSRLKFLKSLGQWDQVLDIYKELKANGEFDNGYVNHFSWQVFKDCDDKKVISQCLTWMKEVTTEEPNYMYLDTYAFLLSKSGDLPEAKRIAEKAIAAAIVEDESSKALEKLLQKIILLASNMTNENSDKRNSNLKVKLNEAASYIALRDTINLEVSEASVAWHMDHIYLMVNQIHKALKYSDESSYKAESNTTRDYVFTSNTLPRGKVTAPESVRPAENVTINTLQMHYDEALATIVKLPLLTENKHFNHPVLGTMNRDETITFLTIHTEHHLKIIRDILKDK